MDNRACNICGQPRVYRKGTNKAGKAWAGWFCPDRSCSSEPQWVNLRKAAGTSPASLQVIGNTLAEINKKLDKLSAMVIKIGKMMKSQLPEAPKGAHIPTGEPPIAERPIPVVEEHGEKPDYPF